MDKKQLLIVGLFGFVFYLAFVGNIPSDGNTRQPAEEEWHDANHTYDHLTAEGQCQESGQLIDKNDFRSFLNEYRGSDLVFQENLLLDTTGDGEEELVKRSILIVGNVCRVHHTIEKDGKILWDRTFEINQKTACSMIKEDGLLEEYNSSALFYLGLSNNTFLEKFDFRGSVNFQASAFLQQILEQTKNEEKKASLRERILNYRGYYISESLEIGNKVYMWDETSESFQCIYEPHIQIS